jgi:predicted small secreted protein
MRMKSGWLLLLCLIGALVAGCNTVKGVGKDVKSAGKEIERGSDKTKEKVQDVMP